MDNRIIKHGLELKDEKVIKLNEFTKAIIEYEKAKGLYKPENWIGIDEKLD